jgi:hypothetical protein
MARRAAKLSPYEEQLVESVPDPGLYENKQDREAVKALKSLSKEKQLKVLHKIGVTSSNPFTIGEEMHSKLLDAIAEVGFGVVSSHKGKSSIAIITPTGSGKKR